MADERRTRGQAGPGIPALMLAAALLAAGPVRAQVATPGAGQDQGFGQGLGQGPGQATDPNLPGPLPGGQDPATFALRNTNPALPGGLPRGVGRPGGASRFGARPRTDRKSVV